MQYEDLIAHVEAGKVVAVAPAVNEDGHPTLALLTGRPSVPVAELSDEQSAWLAVRAVMQLRQNYGI